MTARLFPRWWPNTAEILTALRGLFTYDSGGRAASYLEADWLAPLYAKLADDIGLRFTLSAFQAYADGTASTDWHADTPFDAQAILSLGAERSIGLRRGGFEQTFPLRDGDLLYMPSGFQKDWEHRIPPDPTVTAERCSIVFRTPCPH